MAPTDEKKRLAHHVLRIFSSVMPLALALLAIQAHAQTLPEAKCTGKSDVPWSEQIAGCTRAIESGKYAGRDLAKAFTSRGSAYTQTCDIDRSLADFDQAIRAQPTFAAALYWRGVARRLKGDAVAGEADIAAAKKLDPEVDR